MNGYVRMKLTFLDGKLYANFGKFFFLVKTPVKFRNLHVCKTLKTDTNRIVPSPSKIMYISLRYT